MTEPNSDTTSTLTAEAQGEWERSLLERLAFASLTEQRRARRWGIFFKAFFAAYLLVVLLMVIGAGLGEPRLGGAFTALVDVDGVIGDDASADSVITGLRSAFESNAKGVIVRTNSPGGSPVQAGYINSEIRRLRKQYPDKQVYAVIGDVCASGCYYAVAAADKIYAAEGSIVGSIGVLMNGFGFVETMNKLGIERRLLTAGEDKDFLDPFSPLSARHRQHALELLKRIHEQFITVVREGRGTALKEGPQLYTGLFWTGDEAREMGLVDALGSAGDVAREVFGAEEIVDFTYREGVLNRFARELGVALANRVVTLLGGHTPQLR